MMGLFFCLGNVTTNEAEIFMVVAFYSIDFWLFDWMKCVTFFSIVTSMLLFTYVQFTLLTK